LLLGVIVLFASIGCAAADDRRSTLDTPPPTPDNREPWAAEAETWSTALLEMPSIEGGASFEIFWDPNVDWDIRSMIGGASILHGQNAFTLAKTMYPPDTLTSAPDGRTFLGTDGLVFTTLYDWAPISLRHVDASAPAHLANVLHPIGPRGAERQVSAMAIEDRRDRRFGSGLDAAEEVARAWMRGWTAGNSDRLAELYTDDAVVRDSIGAISATGIEAIVALGADVDWTGIGLATLDDSSPALYPLITSQGEVRGVVMIVQVGSCPGDIAVVLEMEDAKVIADTRYRAIDDARRCVPADQLPDGWWTGRSVAVVDDVPLPTEDLASPTGSVDVCGDAMMVCNSTSKLNTFAEWGIIRFETAGLEAPPISRLVFTTQSSSCADVQGHAALHENEVLLCLDEQATCQNDPCTVYRFRARHVLLHEFAHVWLATNLSDEDRSRFAEHVGLTTWNDSNVPWSERAVEHAAETIAWGLLDQPFAPIFIGRPSASELTASFRLLTGAEPLQPAASQID
jgi:hypothetical protein